MRIILDLKLETLPDSEEAYAEAIQQLEKALILSVPSALPLDTPLVEREVSHALLNPKWSLVTVMNARIELPDNSTQSRVRGDRRG